MSLFNSRTLTFKRKGSVSNVNGVLTAGSVLDVVVSGTVQPVSASELKNLGMLGEVGEVLRFYTSSTTVLQYEQDFQDEVEIDGNTFQVYGVASWGNGLIPHKKYLLKRIS